MTISAERVEAIFMGAMFENGEDTTNHVAVRGIVINVGFHPERLAASKDEISAMLDELPDDSQESGGGGVSFLNACCDKNGNQWTNQHRIVEQLLMLGMGIGKAECLLPRHLWSTLPGGVPYYVIH